eukprot:221151-Amorphochlora_amoeboformis.AAC.1
MRDILGLHALFKNPNRTQLRFSSHYGPYLYPFPPPFTEFARTRHSLGHPLKDVRSLSALDSESQCPPPVLPNMAAVDTLFIYLLSFLPCVSAYTLASEGEEACEMMAVSSDMRREDAQEIMGIFLTQSPEKKDQIATTNTLAVSKRIAERFGGFWDVFILGKLLIGAARRVP